jgi:hypothetical protein
MADTLEYSNVALPRSRFEDELVAELKECCPSLIEEDGDSLVLRHVYIERRMIPLNLYLQDASPAQIEHAVVEYGNAIKDLVGANIFPGDMLWKNFGVTRHGKVVFYDYDEIEYLTDCNFRKVPEPRTEEEAMSGEVWYAVGPKDVFPETFEPFLLGNPLVRDVFMAHHAELLDAGFWNAHKQRILAGYVHDVFPYEAHRRFEHQRRAVQAAPGHAPPPYSRGPRRGHRPPRGPRPAHRLPCRRLRPGRLLPPDLHDLTRSPPWPNPSSSPPPRARPSAACSATSARSPRTSWAPSPSRPRWSAPASPATP